MNRVAFQGVWLVCLVVSYWIGWAEVLYGYAEERKVELY